MPSVRRGYVVSPAATQDLTNAWSSAIALTVVTTDENSERCPADGYFSDLEIDFSDISGSVSVQVTLFYDSACTRVVAGPSGAGTFLNISNAGNVGIFLGKTYRYPSAAVSSTSVPGTVYAKFKLDAGTAKITAYGVRLHWGDDI
jgi:hypothetical protein